MSRSSFQVLVPGNAEGRPFKTDPFSFWGGFESTGGTIIDRFHPDLGACLGGRILFISHGRGSSSGASVLAEAIRLDTAPAGICLRSTDTIIATGAMVAARLYGRACPVVVIADEERWQALASAQRLRIKADADIAQIQVP